MQYKTVYDVKSKTVAGSYFIPLPFFIVFIILFAVSSTGRGLQMLPTVSFGFIAICFLILFLISFTQMIADRMYLITPYRKGQFEIMEGSVSDLRLLQHTAREESFAIGGLTFVYPNTSTKIGYRTVASKGGYITRNGQNIRVTYIYNEKLGKDNVILKLEIEDTEN